MSTIGIRSVVVGSVLELVLDRPERKNAFTSAMYSKLTEELNQAAQRKEIATVLIHGEGGNFSSGNDLKDFLETPPSGTDAPVFHFLTAIATFPKPIVCAVEGFAVGIGTTMLLPADIAYAADTARFQLPFINLGLVPEGGSSLLLPRLAGSKAAHEMLLFGEPFDAHAALQYGLINQIVEQSKLLEFARQRAQLLATKPRAAVLEAKALLKKSSEPELLNHMRVEGEAFIKRLRSPETTAAIQGFFARK
ncbi:MAG TPA: enoyl-CoA hydratase-related protein [Oligoflexus sp.]|uniref:enoyl-CoA hydratase-related protein n=1 Tax=Oligoflexus sp. TaxID=1971216 RepID=UPI002D354289|nr:enoyl-CoA hydratase-related protein [Oligoflexus sp.]HYX34486.1 enoyl-CoA hydratase-related protein [Oligoflexus sp.]